MKSFAEVIMSCPSTVAWIWGCWVWLTAGMYSVCLSQKNPVTLSLLLWPLEFLSSCLWWLAWRHHLFIGVSEVMLPCEQMAQVKPWLCRSCPLNTTNHLLHVIKMSLTRVISHAFWQMWLAGCDMTQRCLLPPCAISLEASSPLLVPISPMPRLAFQLTCSRWAAQWEDTGKGRCVYFP